MPFSDLPRNQHTHSAQTYIQAKHLFAKIRDSKTKQIKVKAQANATGDVGLTPRCADFFGSLESTWLDSSRWQ